MPLNVLITAGSRRVPLVRAFQRAVAQGVRGGRVVVTDVNALSPAIYAADRAYQVPLAHDPGYIDAILRICRDEEVRLVVPTIDDELTLFGEAARRFATAGICLAVSPPETTRICNDKYETCRTLLSRGIAAAETFLPHQIPPSPAFPLFIKPRAGRGGVGAFPVHDRRELDFFLSYVPDPVVQQYLHGPEFTLDLLCNLHGRPLSIVPRERVVIRAGVMDRGRTVKSAALIDLARACADALDFAGPINIQCRVVDGVPTVFEINPRFSGGIPLTIAAGADFPRMLVDLAVGRRVPASIGMFRDGVWMTNYESSMFLEAEAVGFSASREARGLAVGAVA